MTELIQSAVAGGVQRAYQAAKAMPAALAPPAETASFSDVLAQTAAETVETVRHGNRAALAGLSGTLPVQQVVEATMAMESAVQVTVAIRDRVVEAYQEILRMSV